MKPYVYITRKLPSEPLAELKKYAEVEMWESSDQAVPQHVLLEKVKKADGLMTMLSDRIDGALLREARKLKVVANLAVGYDNIDTHTAYRFGVTPCHTPDVLTDTTADLAFGLMMATARRLVEAAEFVKAGDWQSWSPLLLAGRDLHHKTLGIVGMGRIGKALAKRAAGFDMNVLYHNRGRYEELEKVLHVTYASFDQLLEAADFIVCLTPLTETTRNMFGADAFGKMKSSAIFVNVSRGAVVDEDALYQALMNKEISGAGLDVYQEEPLSADHPLLGLKEVVALPHIGSASTETRYKMIELAAENIINVLKGEKAVTPVREGQS